MSAQIPGSPEGPVRPEDLEVTLAVRRDLGPANEQAVIGEFLDRVGWAIDARVDARVGAWTAAGERSGRDQRSSAGGVALGIVSLIAGIPITAIVLGVAHSQRR